MSTAHQTKPERGASAVEYALLISGIAALIVLVVFALGAQTSPLFDETCDAMAVEMSAASCG